MRTVSAADANRHFSKLLREVANGEPVIVTSHGRPMVRIVPMSAEERLEAERVEADRQRAWEDFVLHLRTRPALNIPITWTRDDVYDDDF